MIDCRITQPWSCKKAVGENGVHRGPLGWLGLLFGLFACGLFACGPADTEGRSRAPASGELSLVAIQPPAWTPKGGPSFFLTGQGFQAGAQVWVNGQPVADAQVVDPAHITGTLPASPDAFDYVPVEVRNTNGTATRRDDLFAYVSESTHFSTHSYFLSAAPAMSRPAWSVTDLNQDLDPDLVAASGSALHVLLGTVGVELVPSAIIGLPGEARAIACADLDADSLPDCVVAVAQGPSAGLLRVFRNTPGQGLAFAVDVTVPGPPGDLALADLDHDGHPDAIATQQSSPELAVFFGVAQGWLAAPQTRTLPDVARSLAVADLNADGNLDIGITVTGRSSVVLSGDGRGGFAAPAFPTYGYDAQQLVLADLNQDAQADLVTSSGDRVTTWLAQGGGTYSAGPSLDLIPSSLDVQAVDMNRDGWPDLLTSSAQALRIDPLTAGGFAAAQTLALSNLLGDPIVSDFDQDGWPDAALLRRRPDASDLEPFITVLRNVGGTLAVPSAAVLGPSPLDVLVPAALRSQVLVRDVNGDSAADLVAVIDAEIVARLASPGSGFREVRSRSLGSSRRPLQSDYAPLSAADLNRDGALDLAFAVSDTADDRSQRIALFFGDGQGHFAPSGMPSPAFSAITSLWLADVDGDTYPDLISHAIPDQSVSEAIIVYLNDRHGQFSAPPRATPLVEAIRITAVRDLTGDGQADLVTLDQGTDVVRVRVGDGRGSFAPRWRLVATHPVTVLGVGELNGDGLADLIMAGPNASRTGTRASAFLGLPGGGFSAATRSDVDCPVSPRSLWLADVTGDRREDVVLAASAGHSVCVLLADGTGALRPQPTITTAPGVVVGVADATSDRRPDLWFASDNGIFVLENHAR